MRRSHAVAYSLAVASLAIPTGGYPTGGNRCVSVDRSFRFSYSVVVREIPRNARELSVWVPVPRDNRYQRVRNLQVTAPLEFAFTHERRYGNRLLHLSASSPLPKEITLRLDAIIVRRAYRVSAEAPQNPQDDPPAPRDLGPDGLVPIDGKIAEAAREATRDARTPLEKARAIYEYVTSSMRYDKSGRGWGHGDAVYACDARRGNCTDFHSLIIGMARASGIPARFVMGFPLPDDRVEGEIPGYHCWAELYVEGVGWLPLDSSEASKHPEKHDLFFGGLDANRVEFTRGRDLELEPAASKRLNFFVYPHVEVDGVEHTEVGKAFAFADVDVR